MSINYDRFINSGGPIREPEIFQELKKDDNFVVFMARNISSNIDEGCSVDEIAHIVLSKVNFDPTFAEEILGRMSEMRVFSNEQKLEGVKKEIHQRGLIKPSDFFNKSTPSLYGREAPELPQKAYYRDFPQSIIPSERENELSPQLNAMVSYLDGESDVKIEGIAAEVLDILEGKSNLEDLSIDESNSAEYLTAAKLWDHAMALSNIFNKNFNEFPVSSYGLRTLIGERGTINSNEAFTKTLDPKEFNDWGYLEKQSSWIPERAGLHAKIVETHLVKALALSRRLNTNVPSVWAVRGNTGSGKTYTIGNDDLFAIALDENGEPSGAINPDTFKGRIKKESGRMSHGQIHMEGSALSYQYAEALGREGVKATMIIDMRLSRASAVKDEVIGRAEIRNGEALMLDIDTPLITSINRIFTRDPDGDDPIVPLWAVKQGYIEIREERAELLREIETNDTVTYYKLFITDDQGVRELAAVKEEGVFSILPGMEDKVKQAMKKPDPDDLEKIFGQMIDEEYIQLALTRDHISQEKVGMIAKWKGYTVRDALEKHARGESP